MAAVKVDLEVGPSMDIEFLAIEGVKVTNAITPTGSKWKISLEFTDKDPQKELLIQLVASGIPGNDCLLSVKANSKDLALENPKKTYNEKGFLYFEEKPKF